MVKIKITVYYCNDDLSGSCNVSRPYQKLK